MTPETPLAVHPVYISSIPEEIHSAENYLTPFQYSSSLHPKEFFGNTKLTSNRTSIPSEISGAPYRPDQSRSPSTYSHYSSTII